MRRYALPCSRARSIIDPREQTIAALRAEITAVTQRLVVAEEKQAAAIPDVSNDGRDETIAALRVEIGEPQSRTTLASTIPESALSVNPRSSEIATLEENIRELISVVATLQKINRGASE